MNIHRIALCYVFLAALCDVNTGFVFDTPVHEEAEGENITVGCSFTWAGNNKKFFCKGECKNENILIETDKDKDQNGRYSIEDKRTGLFFVTITQLTKSDSGSYRCGVDRLLTHSYKEFDITVTDAPTGSTQTSTVCPDTTTDTTDTSAFITDSEDVIFSSGSSTPSSPLSTTQQSEPPAAQDSTHSGGGPRNLLKHRTFPWKRSTLLSQRVTVCMRRSERRTGLQFTLMPDTPPVLEMLQIQTVLLQAALRTRLKMTQTMSATLKSISPTV
ncbi:natural cytotoxicity triggering receptor 2-like isoform X6 [Centroberyx affinis]|uniref:natural cytotoxicity triggering receptor 2-like isoform X6 n=1 Tax=Centroberyx affinis TaxID=166261 RepID=UPI003A5C24B9